MKKVFRSIFLAIFLISGIVTSSSSAVYDECVEMLIKTQAYVAGFEGLQVVVETAMAGKYKNDVFPLNEDIVKLARENTVLLGKWEALERQILMTEINIAFELSKIKNIETTRGQ